MESLQLLRVLQFLALNGPEKQAIWSDTEQHNKICAHKYSFQQYN